MTEKIECKSPTNFCTIVTLLYAVAMQNNGANELKFVARLRKLRENYVVFIAASATAVTLLIPNGTEKKKKCKIKWGETITKHT